MGLGGKVSPTQMQWRHCQIFAWLYHSCCFPHSIQQILRKKPVHVPLVLRVKCSLPEVACVLVAFHAGVSSGPPAPSSCTFPQYCPHTVLCTWSAPPTPTAPLPPLSFPAPGSGSQMTTAGFSPASLLWRAPWSLLHPQPSALCRACRTAQCSFSEGNQGGGGDTP